MPAGKHIAFATFGSLGDVHPFFALGRVLQARGHRVTIATSEYHRGKIEAEGFNFHPVRPDIADFGGPAGLFRAFSDGPGGAVGVLRRDILPRLRETCDDLLAVARQADFLGAHPIYYPAPLVAEKLGLPWAGMLLQPMAMFSAHDPAIIPQVPGLHRLPPFALRAFVKLSQLGLQPLVRPIHDLRRALGLPPTGRHPMFGGQYSPDLNLALFSPLFAPPQPDWPAGTIATGFPFFDDGLSSSEHLPEELAAFLDHGPPPVVFTLGSTAVDLSVQFYLDSYTACHELGCRAVFLAGREALQRLPATLPASMLALPYAPHGALFPRATAIVHSGGIGTTAQALRSGRPQLVVPFGFDQPDNAARAQRLGVARVIPSHHYNRERAIKLLRELLSNQTLSQNAGELGRRIRSENGAGQAADAIEKLLAGP
ncbi:MAG: glycosyltransferase [bacterium]|nr:glycosyltransferase [bacterium]MDI1335590.1 glycosyltransferase [Lacunisphaera sp.]